MKINNIQTQNFKGNLYDSTTKFIANHPGVIATLAGSSVVAQKIVMSGSEAVIGPAMDIGIGKVITKITDEKDNSTNKSSKVQAIRTFSQSVGGTVVGVGVRLLCIGGATLAFMKFGEKAGSQIAKTINPNNMSKVGKDAYLFTQNMEKWGKTVGGAAATLVMLVTNFVIDAPFINWINKKVTKSVENHSNKNQTKEVK